MTTNRDGKSLADNNVGATLVPSAPAAAQHQMDLEAAHSSERAAQTEIGRLREELQTTVAEANHEINRLRAKFKHERRETEIRIIEADDVIDQLESELDRTKAELEATKASVQAVAAMDESRHAERDYEPGPHLHVIVTDPVTGRTIEYRPAAG